MRSVRYFSMLQICGLLVVWRCAVGFEVVHAREPSIPPPASFQALRAIGASPAAGDQEARGANPAQGGGSSIGDSSKVRLYDLDLVDQEDRMVKFESEVIGNRVAVVIPFYTSCTSSYPILIFMQARLQDLLGERLGKDVVLVSLTVDPDTDIPIRSADYAKRQKARPGWVFLSGDRKNLGQVLEGLGLLYSSNLEEHNHIPVTVVGRVGGAWKHFHGFPSPERVFEEVTSSLASRSARR